MCVLCVYNIYIRNIYKRGREPLNTTWRAAGWTLFFFSSEPCCLFAFTYSSPDAMT